MVRVWKGGPSWRHWQPRRSASGLGLMVTGNTYRHPAVLAKIAATVDVISNGRLDFGIGAGWNVYEHDSMGLELGNPGPRIRKFGEACDIFKSLFTEHLTTFEGKYYTLKDARCEPKPVQKPYPPFVIGGSGEQLTLRIVAKHANIWNFGGGDAATFTHKVNVLTNTARPSGAIRQRFRSRSRSRSSQTTCRRPSIRFRRWWMSGRRTSS